MLCANKCQGITTAESCCGHDSKPFKICFKAKSIEDLPYVLYWFKGCHSGFYGWKVYVDTDCAMSPPWFKIEGPSGEQGYKESVEIAHRIMFDMHGMMTFNAESFKHPEWLELMEKAKA